MKFLDITKTNGLLVLALASFVMVACNKKDDSQSSLDIGRQEAVNFTASIGPFQEYNDNGLLQNSSVNRVFGSDDTFTLWAIADNSRPTGTGTAYGYSKGHLLAKGSNPITDDRQSAVYYAVTPSMEATGGVLSFTVSADQSSEDSFWSNDLCTAMAAATIVDVSLNFSHRLCCVCVNLVGDAIKGTISQIRLTGVQLSTRLSFDGDDTQTTGATSMVLTSKQGQSYYAIVPDQSFAAGSVLAVITLDGVDYDVVFGDAVRYEGGMIHYLNAYYHADDAPTFVGLTGDINPWEK